MKPLILLRYIHYQECSRILISVSRSTDTSGYTWSCALAGQCVCYLSEFFIILASVKAVIVESGSLVNMPGKLPGCIDADSLADKGRRESLTLFVRAALVYSEVPAIFLDSLFNRIVGADWLVIRTEYKTLDLQPFFLPVGFNLLNDLCCKRNERDRPAAVSSLSMLYDPPVGKRTSLFTVILFPVISSNLRADISPILRPV